MLRKCKENVKMLRTCQIQAAQDTFIGDTKASMGLPPKHVTTRQEGTRKDKAKQCRMMEANNLPTRKRSSKR